MVVVWAATFVALGWIRHARFTTYGYDLGIYDQGAWLLSRFRGFVTVRGLPILGNHATFILVAFVPFYWLGAGPLFLLVVQVAAQAAGAVAVYLFARDRLGDRWVALLPAAALLLNPTYQYLTWEFFHPDAIAAAALLFAVWAAHARRWGWFTFSAAVAVACREDVALAVAGLGVLIWLWGHRRIGLATVIAGLGWYVLITRLFIPWVLGGHAPFYEAFFPDLGRNAAGVAHTVVTRPGVVWDLVTKPDRFAYYRRLLVPFALLALIGWRPLLLLTGPALAVNVLTSASAARDYRYHYSAIVVAGMAVAAVEGIAVLGRTAAPRRFLAGALAAVALATTVAWGPSPIGVQYRSGIWPLAQGARPRLKDAALRAVPGDAVVSATFTFVPHLTHRPRIYQFPEPWTVFSWGIDGAGLPDPKTVEWLVVDRRDLLTPPDRAIFEALLLTEFRTRFRQGDIVVAQRRQAPSSSASPSAGR